MGAESVPRREVVTGRPRPADGAPAPRPAPPSHPQSEVLPEQLIRRQLTAALVTTALLAIPLGLLPVLLRILPLTGAAPRVPLAVWLVLGVAPYPALLAIGAWYVRRAERNETDAAAGAPAEHP
ncbi:hypothetical protein ABT288_45630 [Streptomyces sp. NPDC001093]|uniref:hypothetical protein n=1 Tax=Streptomyces sp. NPDC001093 TaxID=3154376 RepID=UPI00331A092D